MRLLMSSKPPRAAKNGTCVVPACVTSGASPETAALRMRSNCTSQPTTSVWTLTPVLSSKGLTRASMSSFGFGPLGMIQSLTVPPSLAWSPLVLLLLPPSSPQPTTPTDSARTVPTSAMTGAILRRICSSPPWEPKRFWRPKKKSQPVRTTGEKGGSSRWCCRGADDQVDRQRDGGGDVLLAL